MSSTCEHGIIYNNNIIMFHLNTTFFLTVKDSLHVWLGKLAIIRLNMGRGDGKFTVAIKGFGSQTYKGDIHRDM
jgi:hypothetical protein